MTCENCRFWQRQLDFTGICRRRAPTYIKNGYGIFPLTKHDDWCGEFESKPQPDEGTITREPMKF